MTTHLDTESGAWWETARAAFFTDAAEPEPEPEPEFAPGITAADLDDMSLEEYGERRAAIGFRQPSGFLGVDEDQTAAGFPDYRAPQPVMEREPTELEKYSAQRRELGVRDASAVFGASPAQPRVNASPWQVVQ
jgi:hypothetical protein